MCVCVCVCVVRRSWKAAWKPQLSVCSLSHWPPSPTICSEGHMGLHQSQVQAEEEELQELGCGHPQ